MKTTTSEHKTVKKKRIDTELDEISFFVAYTELIDLQPSYFVEGHGRHEINDSSLEQEIVSVHLKIKDVFLPIENLLTTEQKEYILKNISE